MDSFRTRCALALLSALVCSCAPGDPDDSARVAVRIDSLPGGAVRVVNDAPPRGAEESIPALEPSLVIGAAEGEAPYLFGNIYDFTLDAEGRIYVADGDAKEVRVFAPDGRHLRTLGRRGGGPGELELPIGLAWDGQERLWVVDPRNQRYTLFDTTGALVQTHRRHASGWGAPWIGGIDREGRMLEASFAGRGPAARGQRAIIRHTLSDDGLVPSDTFAAPGFDPGFEPAYYRIETANGGLAMVPVPFAPAHRWVWDGGAGVWSGTSSRFRFVHTTLAGDTLRIVAVEHTPEPVTASDMEGARARLEAVLERGEDAAAARRQIDYDRIPKVKPAWQEVVVSDEGELWVARVLDPDREGMGPVLFDVFDPEGRWRHAVSAPVGLWPTVRILRRHLLGVRYDELGVARVVVAPIEP